MSFHSVNLRAFVHATESEEKVKKALGFIAGDVKIDAKRTKGHFGNPMIILEARITRKKEIKTFFNKIRGASPATNILPELEKRVDDECNLFFRLDKQMAYEEQPVLASNEDVIACRLKIAAYPANRNNAITTAKKFLENMSE